MPIFLPEALSKLLSETGHFAGQIGVSARGAVNSRCPSFEEMCISVEEADVNLRIAIFGPVDRPRGNKIRNFSDERQPISDLQLSS